MSKTQILLDCIMKLQPEQVEKLIQRTDLLQKISNMTDNEVIFINSFIDKVFCIK